MKLLITSLLWIFTFLIGGCLHTAPHAQSREPDQLSRFSTINDTLRTLREHRDDLVTLRLKLRQLEYINRKRAKVGSPPLQLDLLAGRSITAHLAEMTTARTFAHRNRAGEFAYHRWAHTGRTDHVQENLYASFTTGFYHRDPDSLARRMQEAVDAFLAEVPPKDGHRRALLDPTANFVGIGLVQSPDNQSFRYGELFVHKYVELEPVLREMRNGDTLIIRGRMVDPEFGPYAFLGFHTPPLVPPSRDDLFTDVPYPDGSKSVVIERWPWDFSEYRPLEGKFELRIPLRGIEPGVVYGLLYVRDHLSTIPYRGNGKANTEEAIAAGAIVINLVK